MGMWNICNKRCIAFYQSEEEARAARKADPRLKYGRIRHGLQLCPDVIEYGVVYKRGIYTGFCSKPELADVIQ